MTENFYIYRRDAITRTDVTAVKIFNEYVLAGIKNGMDY